MTDALPSASPTPRLGMARGSAPWLLPALAGAGAAVAACRGPRSRALVALPAVATAAAMVWFFRDPDRTPEEGRLVSAADGVVQSIEVQADGRTRVAVFMNPLDVHVNRAPAAGRVVSVEHRPGGYRPAFDKDSERNERMVWTLDSELGPLTVVQIAGVLVRRIVPYHRPGRALAQGERLGLIRFGSRVDVYLPAGVAPAVRVGQRVRAGETRLDRD
jgi:phosphatidylserine decarboxylase